MYQKSRRLFCQTKITAKFDEKVKGSYTEKYDIIWEMDMDSVAEMKDGEKAAVVYLSAINQVFAETMEVWKKLTKCISRKTAHGLLCSLNSRKN